MQIKSVFIVLIIGAVYLHESEAAPKLGLLKAKVALAKVPHVVAHVAVAKEVKAKTKIAAAKTLAAVKATKVAALSAITAPFRAAKKTIALKVGAVKAVKALKVAKIAKAADILKNLQKSPILVPVQVAVPIKGSAHPIKQFPAIPNFLNIPPPSLSDSLAPIQGIISGAQNAIKSAGIPLLTTFGGKFNKAAAPTQAPVYRFVPEVGLGNYNKVALPAPARIEVDIPANPAAIYGPPPTPADTYGVPH